jgi:glycosyltransferase involved in cell wall biosynthesis
MQILHRPGGGLAKAAMGLLATLRRLRFVRPRGFDAVLIHRAACLFGPAWLERVQVWLGGVPIIFDFDDAIYLLHTSEANRAVGWLKFPGKTASICRLSRHVVVANQGLADFARRYNSQVSVVPSSVDTDAFRPQAARRPGGPVRVGWTGSSTSLTYLEMFAPVLEEARARFAFELHVHSDREPELRGVPFTWRPWSPRTEADELGRFDIGIMPMPDDGWARGKSAMKALLYMAMGIPAVCSGVGTNLEVVRHRENGLLARTAVEWCEALSLLAHDGEMRSRLGRAGRRTVEERYSHRHCAAAFANVVREVCG